MIQAGSRLDLSAVVNINDAMKVDMKLKQTFETNFPFLLRN